MSADYRMLIRRTGGPEVIEREAIVPGEPGEGEARVRHAAIGVNFIDIYQRSGLYPIPLPSGLGSEGAGTVEAVGRGVTGIAPGDRVGYAGSTLDAYSTTRVMSADRLVKLPAGIAPEIAAAAMLKGMTVDMLVGECGGVEAGMTVLVHAAAGGVGSLLVQWLKGIGAMVIAHAGTAAKADHAQTLGADHALHSGFDALSEEVRTLTDGRGVDVAFDGVGKASWTATLGSVRKRGMIVSYGNASGPVAPVALLDLTKAGSLFVTRPTLFDYTDTRERLEASAARLFAMIGSGKLQIEIGHRFALANAADAHRAIEARATTGPTILLP